MKTKYAILQKITGYKQSSNLECMDELYIGGLESEKCNHENSILRWSENEQFGCLFDQLF